jgi:CarboxypepD_reg-like domain/TonB dependent receptor/TonB-dependent Receptor Plug Domain
MGKRLSFRVRLVSNLTLKPFLRLFNKMCLFPSRVYLASLARQTLTLKGKPSLGLTLLNSPLFLVCLFLFTLSSNSFAQSINIQRSSIPLGDLLEEITEQSGWNFSYSPQLIDLKQRIPFRIKKASLKETLDKLSSELGIGYTLLENQIILHEKEVGQEGEENLDISEYYTISGYVQDANSGESLIGATVSVKGTTQGVSTNAFGYYVLKLPSGKHTLLFSYIGFEMQQLVIALTQNKKQDVPMKPEVLELPGVLVNTSMNKDHRTIQDGAAELRATEIAKLPEFGGETGIIRSLQTLPGIKAHSDGSAFFFVRGGEKDQNLMILDDAPIYNPAHLFGFYSVVIPDFTKSIQVYKSDVPVHLGDRLSSVIDIRTKDGNLNKTEFNAAFNPLLIHLSLEGPIRKEKSSYFVSYRGSNFGWIYKRENPNNDIGFSDFSLKWNRRINAKNRLYFTFFAANDRFKVEQNFSGISNISWRNATTTFRWNHLFGERLFLNTILYSGNYTYFLGNANNQWTSGIGQASLKSDFTFYQRPEVNWRFGFELNGFTFNTGRVSGDGWGSIFPPLNDDKAQQSVLYLNRTQQWNDRWGLSLGLRYSVFRNVGPNTYYTFDDNYNFQDSVVTGNGFYNRYRQLDPRVKLTYQIDSTSSIKCSYGIYHQNLQLITNSTSPFTALEVWLPSSPNIKPQVAHQVNLSYLKRFPKRGLLLSSELYYKEMSNQIDYVNHANTLLNPLLEGGLRFGNLNAYGIELMLKKEVGRLNGWVNYNYARAIRKTAAVNNGEAYPAFQDRPHDFSLMLNYALKRRILFSLYWTAYTGAAFSSPTGFYTFNNNTIPIYDEKHNDRLPNYRRTDIAFKFVLNKNPEARFKHDLTFSIYNFFARKNVVAVNFNQVLDDNNNPAIRANLLAEDELVATQAHMLRFFPSLTYKLKW